VAAVPLLLAVSFLSFLLLHLAPGSFVDRLRLDPGIPTSTVDALVNQYGLDQPWYRQYVSWLGGALRGDFGISLAFRRPVGDLLSEAAVYTLALAGTALVFSSLFGLVVAVLAVYRPGGKLDRILSGSALTAASIPTLVLAVGGLGLASATGAFPIGGGSAVGLVDAAWSARAVDFLRHLLLPVLVLSAGVCPLFFLQARGALLEVLPSEFVRAARSRGLSEAQILINYGLRPALVPFITFVGSSVARLLSGAFLVEVVMGWPGMGRLALDGLLARDSFLILGVLVLASCLMLVGNLVADVLSGVADPRIRLEEA
jgi:peptide/nickel transport system permease protein